MSTCSGPPVRRRALGEGVRVQQWMTLTAAGLVLTGVLAVGDHLPGAAARQQPATATGRPGATTSSRPAPTSRPTPPREYRVVKPSSPLDRYIYPTAPYFGVSLPNGPHDLGDVERITFLAGQRPTLLEYFEPWTEPINTVWAEDTWQAGMLPVLTWEPWDPWNRAADGTPKRYQVDYTLGMLNSGRYDQYIRAQAAAVRQMRVPIAIRLAHEMNGYWYPWGVATTGSHNTPADYVRAWRHVWQIFHDAGVRNVIWVWSPNVVSGAPQVQLSSVYPGDAYVDWVGLSGYLSGSSRTFAQEYADTLVQLRQVAPAKPWLIAETGASDSDPAVQAGEIASLFQGMRATNRFIGIVWFDHATSQADWRFETHAAALAEFRRQVALSGFAPLPTASPSPSPPMPPR